MPRLSNPPGPGLILGLIQVSSKEAVSLDTMQLVRLRDLINEIEEKFPDEFELVNIELTDQRIAEQVRQSKVNAINELITELGDGTELIK